MCYLLALEKWYFPQYPDSLTHVIIQFNRSLLALYLAAFAFSLLISFLHLGAAFVGIQIGEILSDQENLTSFLEFLERKGVEISQKDNGEWVFVRKDKVESTLADSKIPANTSTEGNETNFLRKGDDEKSSP